MSKSAAKFFTRKQNSLFGQFVFEEDLERCQRERFGTEFALGQLPAVVVADRLPQLLRDEHSIEKGVFRRLAGQYVVDLILEPADYLRCGQQFVVVVY